MWSRSKAAKETKRRKKFFIENGARLSEKLIASGDGKSNPIRNFSFQELLKATNNFSSILILPEMRVFSLYKGTFDGYSITVKKWNNQRLIEDSINEVVMLSQINHKNILKLVGCCLETEVPILVYESATSKGVLSDNIFSKPAIPWNIRLRIAIEIANAISYLHTAHSTPIIHRDIKSSNIFLDENYVAKLSDFSISVSIPLGETHVVDEVKGTFGYVAPEYLASGRITEKTDILSFGMLLLEFLTGQKAWDLVQRAIDAQVSVTYYCRSFIENNRLVEILDSSIWGEEEEEVMKQQQLQAFAEFAIKCTEREDTLRPTMIAVTKELRRIEQLINSC